MRKTYTTMAVMDIIRCDLPAYPPYLVWKWKPTNSSSQRENSIRWGSSLRVKDGEMAVFVYNGKNTGNQDYILGPYDSILKTANLPVLSSLMGLAYGGDTPFQAEVYFINLATNAQILFGVPYFDVFDPRYPDLPIPVAARGTLTFNITDYKQFVKMNRLVDFSADDLKLQIRSMVTKYLKSVIISIPTKTGIPAIQLETQLLEINEMVEELIKVRISDFGVNLKSFDIEAVEINKESDNYLNLKKVTSDILTSTVSKQSELNLKNLEDTQRINAENLEKTLEMQRKEMQHSQRMQTDSNFFNVHALNTQAEVMKAAAGAMGQMGSNNTIDGRSGNGGFNPAGMMAGMMMGGAMGNQMAGMMTQMGQSMNQNFQQNIQTPPAPPQTTFFVLLDGQQTGPFNTQTLSQMVINGQLTPNTYVWKQGMTQWDMALNTELNQLFANLQSSAPPVPPVPPTM